MKGFFETFIQPKFSAWPSLGGDYLKRFANIVYEILTVCCLKIEWTVLISLEIVVEIRNEGTVKATALVR